MLYDAKVTIKLPGNSPQDAIARLKKAIPHWELEVVSLVEADVQPAPIVGTINITLPLMEATNGG